MCFCDVGAPDGWVILGEWLEGDAGGVSGEVVDLGGDSQDGGFLGVAEVDGAWFVGVR